MKLANLKIATTISIILITLGITLAVDWRYLRQVARQPMISQAELAKYDGSDPASPIYLALDGYVYDVSAGRSDFYGPGQVYHELVGKDASILLHSFGGEIIKRKYRIVGVYQP